jgi:hypothetical protein
VPQQNPEPDPSPPFSAGIPTAIVQPTSYPPAAPTSGYPQSAPPQQSGAVPVPAYTAPTSYEGYPPVSGPAGYGQPLSVPPEYGQPIPPKKRSPATAVFASLTVLFFLAAAVLTGLYITKNNAFDKKVDDLKARDTTIAANSTKIKDLETKLQSTQSQLDQANQKQNGTQNQLDELTKEKQVIANCLTLLSEAGRASAANDKTTYDQKISQASKVCSEADKYLK